MTKKHGLIQVISGKNLGKVALIKQSTCKLIGRTIDDSEAEADETYVADRVLELGLAKERTSQINAFLNPEKKNQSGEQIQSPYRRTSDFIIDDPELSRAHAMIFLGELKAGIIDLASTNGTIVDGKKIESAFLHGGEIIVLGETEIKFSFVEDE